MKEKDYTATFTVNTPVSEVFKSINTVTQWWTDDLEGKSQKLNDEFSVHFGDVHYSKQKLVELVPNKKVTWLVTDSKLNFVQDKYEWTNTKITFELVEKDGKTQVVFTHHGLLPGIQCYEGCSKGWDHYFKGSLFKFLTEGKGTPGL